MTKLIYIADPMCSWCYGFGPQIETLRAGLPDIPFEIVVGGLRAFNTKIMDADLANALKTHWQQVAKVSGLPFTEKAISKKGFVYDTEPACRAVVTARTIAPDSTLMVLHAIQHEFYAIGMDVTQGDVLSAVCAEALSATGIETNAIEFFEKWNSEEMARLTNEDFILTKHWQVSGFPTLVLEQRGQLQLVSSGYLSTEALIERMQNLVDQES